MFNSPLQKRTDSHEILLFSLCIKSQIVVFKMTKQLPEENEDGFFFVSREIICGNIIKHAKLACFNIKNIAVCRVQY